jgi:hypothetical protein
LAVPRRCAFLVSARWRAGDRHPKVAILSAVETVTLKLWSTLEAASLCKMADRQRITGGVVDGPLAPMCVLTPTDHWKPLLLCGWETKSRKQNSPFF